MHVSSASVTALECSPHAAKLRWERRVTTAPRRRAAVLTECREAAYGRPAPNSWLPPAASEWRAGSGDDQSAPPPPPPPLPAAGDSHPMPPAVPAAAADALPLPMPKRRADPLPLAPPTAVRPPGNGGTPITPGGAAAGASDATACVGSGGTGCVPGNGGGGAAAARGPVGCGVAGGVAAAPTMPDTRVANHRVSGLVPPPAEVLPVAPPPGVPPVGVGVGVAALAAPVPAAAVGTLMGERNSGATVVLAVGGAAAARAARWAAEADGGEAGAGPRVAADSGGCGGGGGAPLASTPLPPGSANGAAGTGTAGSSGATVAGRTRCAASAYSKMRATTPGGKMYGWRWYSRWLKLGPVYDATMPAAPPRSRSRSRSPLRPPPPSRPVPAPANARRMPMTQFSDSGLLASDRERSVVLV